MKNKIAFKRFSDMLKDNNNVFVEAGSNLHLDNATVIFSDEVVTVKRDKKPSRSFPYSRLNLDPCTRLLCKSPKINLLK